MPAVLERIETRMLTVRQGAQYLGISLASMYKLIHTSGFPLMKAGRFCYRIEEGDLRAWLREASTRNKPEQQG